MRRPGSQSHRRVGPILGSYDQGDLSVSGPRSHVMELWSERQVRGVRTFVRLTPLTWAALEQLETEGSPAREWLLQHMERYGSTECAVQMVEWVFGTLPPNGGNDDAKATPT